MYHRYLQLFTLELLLRCLQFFCYTGRCSSQLRAKYNVAPPDALQVAASLSFGAKAFLTNDKRLSRLQEFIDVLVLDDFLE